MTSQVTRVTLPITKTKRKRSEIEMTDKTCTKCDQTFPAALDNFYNCKTAKDGLQSWCKVCQKARAKQSHCEIAVTPERKLCAAKYQKEYRNSCPQRAVAHLIRLNTGNLLPRIYKTSEKELGCTSEFLMTYLESKFYKHPVTGESMTWDNRGKPANTWRINHIRPLSSFDLTDPVQREVAANWTNLEPVWHSEHMDKHHG